MKTKILFCIAAQVFSLAVARAENYTLVMKIDIVESKTAPGKYTALENLDKLTRRNSGLQMKYVAGGTFTLQEFLENNFVLKAKDMELKLRAGYSKVTDFKFKIYYDAVLSLPMQENVMRFTNDFVMEYNEIKILDRTKLASGAGDTRPYWVILRLAKVSPEYFEENIGGIGVFLNIKDGYPYALDITPNGPADRQGLKINDIIMEIDEVNMYGKNLQESIDKIRGKPGTAVKLKVKTPGKKSPSPREITVDRIVMK
ncbi:MAG: hypothetical protein A2297_00915 [Elusimicrobia bacterium RIFOXYB2_FULL_48_7]|nr:MAG: hypothetical protein A2297_00915 [Elusimicrobia bacterium RIFOXYB2_FULL_48_7]